MASTFDQSPIHVATLITFLMFLLPLPLPSSSADSDPLQDFCVADMSGPVFANGFPCKPATSVTSDDFFFYGISKEGNTKNFLGSSVTLGNIFAFPALNAQGISMNRIDLEVGGSNPPHSHPHATEIGVVVQGRIMVGFITTENYHYHRDLTAGHVYVVPKGLIHFHLNIGEQKATIISAHNSHMPRTYIDSMDLFCAQVPYDVLAKTFQHDHRDLDSITAPFTRSQCSTFPAVG